MSARRRTKKKRGNLAFPVLMGLIVLAGLVGIVVSRSAREGRPEPPAGVETFEDLSRDHVEQHEYDHIPPVGGPHSPVWQNCGFYEEPVEAIHAVHSLEHGAVWITYRPTLPEEQVDVLRRLAGRGHVLVSPWQDGRLPAPVVVTAWGTQLELRSATDPDLEQFVEAFRLGPEAPEPGASCSGGIGTPV